MLATLHPTKEQVRAYMHQRQRAFDRCPPPMPEEIRRQLGWHCSPDGGFGNIDHLSSTTLFFPGTIAQLATLLAVEWCFLAAGISRPN
ncbi:hypothetical protein ACEN9F_26050 [Duganella sp. CT11-25]|jgi:hypothetical protein|uniref:hypothetical protein n=1 Tax=unclassified Duganella TaxID=2636909 RepID=UPI0039B1114C